MFNPLSRWFGQHQPNVLYIIRGIPGTGKTTLGKKISKYVVAADDMPGLYDHSFQPPTYNLALQAESHEWCKAKIKKWMQEGKRTIAVSNTFIKQKYLRPYLLLATEYGYVVQVIQCEAVVFPDGSAAQSIHGVPKNVVARMKSTYQSWEM